MSLHYYMTIHHLDRPSSDRQILHKYFRKRAENALWTMTMSLTKAQSSISSGALLWRHCTTSSTSEKNNLINDIDIFCCIQKNPSFWCLSPGSPDPGPNLRRRSSQYSLQGAGPALLLRPWWCFPRCVFFCILYFCVVVILFLQNTAVLVVLASFFVFIF